MRKILLIGVSLYYILIFNANATVLFSDRFNNSADWDGRTDAVSELDSEIVGDWQGVWCSTQSDDSHAEVATTYGYSGKGLRFTLTENGCGAPSMAQESCFFSNGSTMSEQTLFWGFRFKISTTNWGTSSANKTLKMTRFYSGGNSIIPGITGDDHSLGVFPLDGGGYLSTGYTIDDTDWHIYIFQFTASDNNDGIVRLWVDNVLEYESTSVDYNGTTLYYDYFPMIQGNLSGGYNGPGLNTYWDDFIWATTKAEIEGFLGVSSSISIPGSQTITTGGSQTLTIQ